MPGRVDRPSQHPKLPLVRQDERPLVVLPDSSTESTPAFNAASTSFSDASICIQRYLERPQTTEEWLTRIGTADGVVFSWHLPSEVLRELTSVKVACFLGTGVSDNIDLSLARQKKIEVLNVSGYGDSAVAEHTIALLLGAVRAVPSMDRAIRRGEWRSFQARDLSTLTLGVIGLGGIGRKVASLAEALGIKVVGWKRVAEDGVVRADGFALAPLSEIFSSADIISIHLDLNDETEGLISASLLSIMKPTAYFINTARSALVDTESLLTLLEEKRIAGAAVDVFDEEPPSNLPRLINIDDLTMTPHIAYNTSLASVNLFRSALSKTASFLTGSTIE